MYRLALGLTLALSLALTSPHVLAATTHARLTKAERVAKQMVAALERESHIQVVGTARGSTRPSMAFTLRYQATAREEYWVSTPRKKSVLGSKTLTSLHYILVGNDLYTFVSSRWYKLRGSSVPNAIDVLNLNANNTSCCVSSGVRPGEVIRYKGIHTWHGARSYVLTYTGASSQGGAFGRLYISTSTHLPVGYTVTNATDKTTGTFTVSYGGKFSISAPKT